MLWSRIEALQTSVLRVGGLIIDRAERRATLAGRPLELSPLLFCLLLHLAEHPGEIVARADLKKVLWPYAERIDTERRLNTAMRSLRAALGDDANSPRLIETVRSHGYRWIVAEPQRGKLKLAMRAMILTSVSIALAPQPIFSAPDLKTSLKAQNAMEEWRRNPTAPAAVRASSLLDQAGAGISGKPSLLAMRAELELGSRWRWSEAERDYLRALDSDPASADARLGLAWLRADQGRNREALGLVQTLLDNGVLSGDRIANVGWLLIRIRRADLAAETCSRDASASINELACSEQALAALGRFAEANQAALHLMGRVGAPASLLTRVEASDPRQARRLFLKWRSQSFLPSGAPWFQRAQVLADAGDTGGALEALQRSVAGREAMATKIYSTPSFARLQQNPAYRALVRQVGLRAF
jgi:DNA-binding winged helix-turn-helix (wHTH) protein